MCLKSTPSFLRRDLRVIVLFSTLLGCCKGRERIVYINKIPLVSLYEVQPQNQNSGSVRPTEIPYNTAVSLLNESARGKDGWQSAKISWQGKLFEISDGDFAPESNPLFFKTVRMAGLDLHEMPNLQSGILAVLPFKSVGKIFGVQKKAETIKGRPGYWLSVTYGNKSGWLFSGFVLSGPNPALLDLRQNTYRLKAEDVTPVDVGEVSGKATQIGTINNFVFWLMPYDKRNAQIDERFGTDVYISRSDRVRKLSGAANKVILTNWQSKFLQVLFQYPCSDCDVDGSHVIFRQIGDSLFAYSISLGSDEGECGPMGAHWFSETRLSNDGKMILILEKFPICEGTFESVGGPYSNVITKDVEYFGGQFRVIPLIGGALFETETADIPAAYAEIWKAGKVLKRK